MKANSFSSIKPLRQRQAGYTLIELSISLAIIAVLLVGTLTGVQRLLRANNANNTVSSTQAALTNITKLFAASADRGIYATQTLAQMGVWERQTLIRDAANAVIGARNPFGGTITVFPNTIGFGAGVNAVEPNLGYWNRLNGIPGESCASVATSFVNTADAIYISTLPSDAQTRPNDDGYTDPNAQNAANLAAGCGAVAADGTVTVHLYVPS